MAEGGVRTEDQAISAASGSEFIFDFYCEVCKDDGLNEEAQGFCVDCKEYLCDSCIRAHRKSRPTRNHDLLDQESMPKDTPLPQDRVRKDVTTKCETHSNKVVEFFCASHDTLGCSTCFATVHKNCPEIESIQEKSENILDSTYYKTFASDLRNMVQTSRNMIAKTRENIGKTEQCCAEAINKIKKLREEFVAMFDELEQNLITHVEIIASEDKESMRCLKEELETLVESVEMIRSECENLASAKRVSQLYIEMKNRKGELASLREHLSEAEINNGVRVFEIEPNNDLRDRLRSDGLGKLVVSDATNTYTTAVHVSNIDVKMSTDNPQNTYYIIGSVVMSSTRLIVADHENKKLKLLDTDTQKVVSELNMPHYPFDIAMINENLAAVAILSHRKILLIKVTKKSLSIDRKISVHGHCHGVAYSQNKLLVTFEDKLCLNVLDLQGNVIKTIDKDGDGQEIFSKPRHVCVSNNGKTIYVSDTGAEKVICLGFDGVVKSVFKGLREPRTLCVDHYGRFFVAGSNDKTVHMVERDCAKSDEILAQADGLNNKVLSVSLCNLTHRLYVGMSGSPTIKVYQLS